MNFLNSRLTKNTSILLALSLSFFQIPSLQAADQPMVNSSTGVATPTIMVAESVQPDKPQTQSNMVNTTISFLTNTNPLSSATQANSPSDIIESFRAQIIAKTNNEIANAKIVLSNLQAKLAQTQKDADKKNAQFLLDMEALATTLKAELKDLKDTAVQPDVSNGTKTEITQFVAQETNYLNERYHSDVYFGVISTTLQMTSPIQTEISTWTQYMNNLSTYQAKVKNAKTQRDLSALSQNFPVRANLPPVQTPSDVTPNLKNKIQQFITVGKTLQEKARADIKSAIEKMRTTLLNKAGSEISTAQTKLDALNQTLAQTQADLDQKISQFTTDVSGLADSLKALSSELDGISQQAGVSDETKAVIQNLLKETADYVNSGGMDTQIQILINIWKRALDPINAEIQSWSQYRDALTNYRQNVMNARSMNDLKKLSDSFPTRVEVPTPVYPQVIPVDPRDVLKQYIQNGEVLLDKAREEIELENTRTDLLTKVDSEIGSTKSNLDELNAQLAQIQAELDQKVADFRSDVSGLVDSVKGLSSTLEDLIKQEGLSDETKAAIQDLLKKVTDYTNPDNLENNMKMLINVWSRVLDPINAEIQSWSLYQEALLSYQEKVDNAQTLEELQKLADNFPMRMEIGVPLYPQVMVPDPRDVLNQYIQEEKVLIEKAKSEIEPFIHPFTISASTTADGQNNIMITVDEHGNAIIVWNGQTYQSIYDPATQQIMIDLLPPLQATAEIAPMDSSLNLQMVTATALASPTTFHTLTILFTGVILESITESWSQSTFGGGVASGETTDNYVTENGHTWLTSIMDHRIHTEPSPYRYYSEDWSRTYYAHTLEPDYFANAYLKTYFFFSYDRDLNGDGSIDDGDLGLAKENPAYTIAVVSYDWFDMLAQTRTHANLQLSDGREASFNDVNQYIWASPQQGDTDVSRGIGYINRVVHSKQVFYYYDGDITLWQSGSVPLRYEIDYVKQGGVESDIPTIVGYLTGFTWAPKHAVMPGGQQFIVQGQPDVISGEHDDIPFDPNHVYFVMSDPPGSVFPLNIAVYYGEAYGRPITDGTDETHHGFKQLDYLGYGLVFDGGQSNTHVIDFPQENTIELYDITWYIFIDPWGKVYLFDTPSYTPFLLP